MPIDQAHGANALTINLDKPHTAALSAGRIKRNLFPQDTADAAGWRKEQIKVLDCEMEKKGKTGAL